MFGRVPGTRPSISESHSEISTRVLFCIAQPLPLGPFSAPCKPKQRSGCCLLHIMIPLGPASNKNEQCVCACDLVKHNIDLASGRSKHTQSQNWRRSLRGCFSCVFSEIDRVCRIFPSPGGDIVLVGCLGYSPGGEVQCAQQPHARSQSAGPNKTWRQAVATLGRPTVRSVFAVPLIPPNKINALGMHACHVPQKSPEVGNKESTSQSDLHSATPPSQWWLILISTAWRVVWPGVQLLF